ncbi:unnamed protein product [Caenorhabditis bovis]|uniref:Uncharacterized protein n=1 Tax=Caenorhabditis bovis TaxID=2654633 RepID=A0A8S1EZE3_9PELO|nr:unnamed protein product [Caenorhabditis bovis]
MCLLSVNKKFEMEKYSSLTNRYQVRESLRSLRALWTPVRMMLFVQIYFIVGSFLVYTNDSLQEIPRVILIMECNSI